MLCKAAGPLGSPNSTANALGTPKLDSEIPPSPSSPSSKVPPPHPRYHLHLWLGVFPSAPLRAHSTHQLVPINSANTQVLPQQLRAGSQPTKPGGWAMLLFSVRIGSCRSRSGEDRSRFPLWRQTSSSARRRVWSLLWLLACGIALCYCWLEQLLIVQPCRSRVRVLVASPGRVPACPHACARVAVLSVHLPVLSATRRGLCLSDRYGIGHGGSI